MFSCWAAPDCAARVVAPPPGEQLWHCAPHTQCTAEAAAPYWAMTEDRTAACCPAPVVEEYRETWARQHLQGGKEGIRKTGRDDAEAKCYPEGGAGSRGGVCVSWYLQAPMWLPRPQVETRQWVCQMSFPLVIYTVTQWDMGLKGHCICMCTWPESLHLSWLAGNQRVYIHQRRENSSFTG